MGPLCTTWSLWACADYSPGAGPEASRSTDYDATPGLDIKAHMYRYVAGDLTFVKASGLVHPQSKDQVLIYTPESREAIVSAFLAQGNYARSHHRESNL